MRHLQWTTGLMPCSYSDVSVPELSSVSPFAYSAILELRHALQNCLCTALSIRRQIHQGDQSVIQTVNVSNKKGAWNLYIYRHNKMEGYSHIKCILWCSQQRQLFRQKSLHSDLGASGPSRDKVQDHRIHLGNTEKLETSCCCQARTRGGELPGVGSRNL